MYLRHQTIIDHIITPDTVQHPKYGIEESMCINVMDLA